MVGVPPSAWRRRLTHNGFAHGVLGSKEQQGERNEFVAGSVDTT